MLNKIHKYIIQNNYNEIYNYFIKIYWNSY